MKTNRESRITEAMAALERALQGREQARKIRETRHHAASPEGGSGKAAASGPAQDEFCAAAEGKVSATRCGKP
ncbi:MAG: hypothetical protein ACK5X3_08715 [Pseudomonadota bacterium]|jgi:hypothetical protein